MRITSKGQVTIPQHIRERFGLLPHSEVEFVVEGAAVRIVRVDRPVPDGRGQRVLQRLRGSATVELTTDEILALTREP